MPMMMPAGSMPVWSYYLWGMIGLIIFWWSYRTFIYTDPTTHKRTYFWENLIGMMIGAFLIYYWLNKIGIVPMYPWQLDHWFFGFR